MDDFSEDLLELVEDELDAEPVDEKKEKAKVFSFRMTPETKKALDAICKETGLTSAMAFERLVELYNLDEAKKVIPSREAEIENFESLLRAISAAFVNSLELNLNAENRIRQTVATELQAKDQAILDYQEQLQELKAKVKEKEEKIKDLAPLEKQLFASELEIKDLQNQLQDQKRYLDIAQKTADTMTDKAEKYDTLLEEKHTVDAALTEKEAQLKEKQAELDAEKKISVEKINAAGLAAAQKTATEWENKLSAERKAFQNQMDDLQKSWIAKLDSEHTAFQSQLEQQRDKLESKHDTDLNKLHEEIRRLERKIGTLELEKQQVQTEYDTYKKAHPEQQDEPDQLTLDDVKKSE